MSDINERGKRVGNPRNSFLCFMKTASLEPKGKGSNQDILNFFSSFICLMVGFWQLLSKPRAKLWQRSLEICTKSVAPSIVQEHSTGRNNTVFMSNPSTTQHHSIGCNNTTFMSEYLQNVSQHNATPQYWTQQYHFHERILTQESSAGAACQLLAMIIGAARITQLTVMDRLARWKGWGFLIPNNNKHTTLNGYSSGSDTSAQLKSGLPHPQATTMRPWKA